MIGLARNLIRALIFTCIVGLIYGIIAFVGAGVVGLVLGQSLALASAKAGLCLGIIFCLYLNFGEKRQYQLSIVDEISYLMDEVREVVFGGEHFKLLAVYVCICIVLGRWLF